MSNAQYSKRLWVLGASDPEMASIEKLLLDHGERVAYAFSDGHRVRPENAYVTDAICNDSGNDILPQNHMPWLTIIPIECGGPGIVDREMVWGDHVYPAIDHHHSGDPGYGRPPSEFLAASSIGQVIATLTGVPANGSLVSHEVMFVAAADHCLGAAYRGECPGVDPNELMKWRVASRAGYQHRCLEVILNDINRARVLLRNAPEIVLCQSIRCRDMRDQYASELPEAAAREGLCFVARFPFHDGRTKIVCQSGSPEQIDAFMRVWGPAHGLQDIYGDPQRGFAGGYEGI